MTKRAKTPTFLLELPLQVDSQQAKHLRAHFEAARCLYNALLGEAMKRFKQMRDDPRWKVARALPKTKKQERHVLFSSLREEYGFSEYALHAYATRARTSWIAEHIDSNTAQKLATRAYQAANRVCLGQAKKVRFKSRKRGLDSVEGKSNATKPLSQRWHQCPCGIGPVQRDVYSAFLVAHLDLRTSVPSIAHEQWESAETRLRAAIEDVAQRANAGRDLPQSMGMPRARARLPQSLEASHQELVYRHGRLEAVGR